MILYLKCLIFTLLNKPKNIKILVSLTKMTSTENESLCSPQFFTYKRHKCDFCSYRSISSWNLRRHKKAIHKSNNIENPTISTTKNGDNIEKEVKEPDNSINDVDVSNIISEDTNSSKRKETDELELEGETNKYKDNDSNTMIDHTNLNKRKQTDELEGEAKKYKDDISNTKKRKRTDELYNQSKKYKVSDNSVKEGNIILSSNNDEVYGSHQTGVNGPFDIRLIENFKMAIFGPSRSGKSVFVSNILKHLDVLSREKPENVIYIFAKWQEKLEEMKSQNLVDIFLEGNSDNIQSETDIESILKRHLKPNVKNLVIFDDQGSNKNVVEYVAKLFSIDARHSGISAIWVSQFIFDGPNLRKIRKNSDYITLFKCPQDCLDISRLSSQMTNSTLVVDIYEKVTEAEPYSYILIDVTQEGISNIQYRSHLFKESGIIQVHIPQI